MRIAVVSDIKISIDDKSLIKRARDKSFLQRILSGEFMNVKMPHGNTVELAELGRLHPRDRAAMFVKNEQHFHLRELPHSRSNRPWSESRKSSAINGKNGRKKNEENRKKKR